MPVTASAEDFENNVADYLSVQLQPYLDATAARYLDRDRQSGLADPDGTSWVVLSAAAQIWPGGIDVPTVWPGIEVAVPDQLLTNFSIGQQDADSELRLIVVVWLKDPRFAVLNAMSKRYAAAVHACLSTPGALGDASIVETRFAWRTDPEVRDQNKRFQMGSLIAYTLGTGMVRA